MGRTIVIANQKGGVGKTTTSINLSASLAELGKKVLVVDMDPQGNTTSGLGVEKENLEETVYELLLGEIQIEDCLIREKFENLSIIPSNINLAGAEIELIDVENKQYLLKNALDQIREDYDFILIDCPPSLNMLTINAMCAGNTILVPIQCEYYALEGLSQLMATVRQVKRLYNPVIEVEGILLTMYDKRLRLTEQVEEEVKKHFPDKLYKTVIPRNVRLSEAPSFGMPVMYFDKLSKGSRAYMDLAKEFLKKNRVKKG